jgi:hypothetical protein
MALGSAPNHPYYTGKIRRFPCEFSRKAVLPVGTIHWIENRMLTETTRDAAMQRLQCRCVMSEILDCILRTSGRSELDAQSRAKIIRYLETLRSAGNWDEQQLTIFGLAYLDQLFNPDPQYSGC